MTGAFDAVEEEEEEAPAAFRRLGLELEAGIAAAAAATAAAAEEEEEEEEEGPTAAALAPPDLRTASRACLLTLCGANAPTAGLSTAEQSSSRTTERSRGWLKSDLSRTQAESPSATRRRTG